MCHRNDRHGYASQADQLADFTSPQAGGVDDDLSLDDALVCDHFMDASILQVNLFDIRIHEDARPAALRADRQRVRQTGRVDDPIAGSERRANHALQRHLLESFLRLFGRDQLHLHIEGARHAHQALDLLHALRRGSEVERMQE